ncbi:MAG: substrate-binding domain-containing protein [Opitutales bacterium]|nr:substrate-binding domain-containing protein [Opitutales bacterium]NRA26035.1 substrate-binding domain-containing protein [Opitutales bacterium]
MRRIILLLGSYDYSLHRGVVNFAREQNWHLDLSLLKKLELPKNYKADGILCLLTDNEALEAFVKDASLPTVDLSVWRSDLPLHRVTADNYAIGKLGAEHLMQQGHSRFLFYTSVSNRVSDLRWQGFHETLKQHGLKSRRLVEANDEDLSLELDATSKPLAVMGNSDLDASEVASICDALELAIPQSVSILGVDNNLLICECQSAPLSSVDFDFENIGYEGAKRLHELIEDTNPESLTHRMIEPGGIIVRKSTDALAVQDTIVREAIAFIQNNLHRSIGTPEICTALNVARRTLEIRFKAAVQMTIRSLINKLRMERAEQALTQSDVPIEDISAELGFCNAAHFSRSFKAHCGISPSRFRSQNSEN